MSATYNPYLVVISALVAFLASYTALDLAGRVAASRGRERNIWLIGGASAMGTGIWAMHFLGMLAFSLPISISYNFWIVIVSLLAAILASGQALSIVSRPKVGFSALMTSATLMGIGIGLMHYIGMAAMQMTATIQWQPFLFILSVVEAVVISLVALKLFLGFRRKSQGVGRVPQIVAAIVMASAVLLLHYTGMAAADFTANYQQYVEPASFNNSSLAFLVATFTFLILGATLIIVSDKTEERGFSG